MSVFSGIDLSTLSLRLSAAQTAYDELNTGQQVASIGTGDTRITFTAAEVSKLKQYILDLQAAIAAATGNGTRRRGVYITGGKGL
jgi:hypothetical protein